MGEHWRRKTFIKRMLSVFCIIVFLIPDLMPTLNIRAGALEKSDTNDTYLGLGGSYSIEYILSNYNVFSFEGGSGSHIVGPVIVRDELSHPSIDGKLFFGDYHRGISSFLGTLTADSKAGSGHNPGIDIPNLYTDKTGNKVYTEFEYGILKYFADVKGDNRFKANNDGDPIYQNDNFIDWRLAKETIDKESNLLLNDSGNIEIKPDKNGYVEIKAGNRYLLKNINDIKVVNIVFPQGENTSYILNTIISMEENEWNNFPNINVNGRPFNASLSNPEGSGHVDYGVGTNVVWNAPNMTEIRRSRGETDILGHFVAPNAIFVNRSGDGQHIGGSYNGTMIVKNLDMGKAEGHMFPLRGPILRYPVEVVLGGDKTLDGIKPNDGIFEFELYDKKDNRLIQKVSTQNGKIKFDKIVFDKVGRYEYYIKEVTGDDFTIDYDKRIYDVVVDVELNGNKYEASISYSLNGSNTDNIIFENKTIIPGAIKVELEGEKTLDGQIPTDGVFKFALVDKTTGKVVQEVSTVNGKINFTELTFDKEGTYLYEIKEVKG
ncbi:MAG: Spy0128 family protein, partial [Clostridium sp.]